jgi:hypothetical protein
MNNSHDIIRDQNGYFRHPNGYPLVLIFDSKNGEDKPPSEISWQEPITWSHTQNIDKEGELIFSAIVIEANSNFQYRHYLCQVQKRKTCKYNATKIRKYIPASRIQSRNEKAHSNTRDSRPSTTKKRP